MAGLFGVEEAGFPARFLLVLKCVWGFIALVIASSVSDDMLETIISLTCITAPIWAHDGLRWLFRFGKMPLWAMLLGLLIQFLAILIVGDDLSNDYSGKPILVLAGMIVAFLALRGIRNYQEDKDSPRNDLHLVAQIVRQSVKIGERTFSSKNRKWLYLALFMVFLAMIGRTAYLANFAAQTSQASLTQENPYHDVVKSLVGGTETLSTDNLGKQRSGVPTESLPQPPLKQNVTPESLPETSDEATVFLASKGEYGAATILLTISLVLTWGVGLLPAFIIRYAIVRHPLGKWAGSAVTFGLLIFNLLIAYALNPQHFSEAPHTVQGLVAMVAFWILTRKPKVRVKA